MRVMRNLPPQTGYESINEEFKMRIAAGKSMLLWFTA
jgi:hypothetical protein